MWQCAKCRKRLEDDFGSCWNCGTSKDGVEDPDFRKVDEVPSDQVSEALAEDIYLGEKNSEAAAEAVGSGLKPEESPITCSRCRCELDYVGTKAFHEGARWGVLGDFAELFVNKERFDVYCCPRCGQVEFFVDGIGEQFRPH
jgi:Zn finger protein HypA/HybF involved in hydrogenase expression